MSNKTSSHDAAAAVARRGITLHSSQGARSSEGGRLPESARKAAQSSIRSAMKKQSKAG